MRLHFIIDKKYDLTFESDEEVRRELNRLYDEYMEELKQTRKEYQKSWNKINDAFSDYIEQITGYEWFFSDFYCLVSPMHVGFSSWGGEQIVRGWRENPDRSCRITAHELIISHYFSIIQNHYNHKDLTNGQIWALAEIAAFALTSLTDEVKEFWPWDEKGYYYDHNYPNLVTLQKQMKDIFLKRKDFDEYIQKGIELVKKYPGISPMG